jgi:hypothetical protein
LGYSDEETLEYREQVALAEEKWGSHLPIIQTFLDKIHTGKKPELLLAKFKAQPPKEHKDGATELGEKMYAKQLNEEQIAYYMGRDAGYMSNMRDSEKCTQCRKAYANHLLDKYNLSKPVITIIENQIHEAADDYYDDSLLQQAYQFNESYAAKISFADPYKGDIEFLREALLSNYSYLMLDMVPTSEQGGLFVFHTHRDPHVLLHLLLRLKFNPDFEHVEIESLDPYLVIKFLIELYQEKIIQSFPFSYHDSDTSNDKPFENMPHLLERLGFDQVLIVDDYQELFYDIQQTKIFYQTTPDLKVERVYIAHQLDPSKHTLRNCASRVTRDILVWILVIFLE